MTSNELQELYSKHQDQPGIPLSLPGEPVAVVFGTDEVRVDENAGTVAFKGLGPMPADGVTQDILKADWIALLNSGDSWDVATGYGNPFENPGLNGLPTKDGFVMAMPNFAKELSERGFVVGQPQLSRAERRAQERQLRKDAKRPH